MAKLDFSVFEVLDIDHEKYYSRILAWLLDPAGSHRQKDFFLKWLLRRCELPTKIKYESVRREEWIKGENDAARQFIDIALRCEGYLIYIEVKKDNRSIDKLQPSIQFELGQKLAEGENRQFAYVFLAPDETTPNRVSLPKGTKLITWSKVRDTLREQLHKLENKARRSKTLAEQTTVLDFLRQFIDRVERRVIGEFVGLDPYDFKRWPPVLGNYVDEAAVRNSLGDFLTAVKRRVETNLPGSLSDAQFATGTRSDAGCWLYCYFYDYHRLNIQLFFDLVAEAASVGLWLDNARHRPKLLPELEAKQSALASINVKWPKKGAWRAVGPNIWDIRNSNKMLDQAVEQLALYLKVFGPTIKTYVKENRLGAARKSKPRQAEAEFESMDAQDIPYPPDEDSSDEPMNR